MKKPTPMVLNMRAMDACIRYAQIDRLIKDVTFSLGEQRCDDHRPSHELDDNLLDLQLVASESCLDRLYNARRAARRYGGRADDISLCPSCAVKHELIQRRRNLRQKLGAAKREIVRVGKLGGFNA